jgi:hypothetical protein
MHLDKKIEILGHQLNGVWYELHVDATEQRKIFEIFAERGEVTEEIWDELQEEVDKIDNI